MPNFVKNALPLLSMIFFIFGMIALSAQADPALDVIVAQYKEQCDALQAPFRGVDDDLDAPLHGELTLADDAIYEVTLTPDGVTGTVLYNEFYCTNIGAGWCGTSGCGFSIIIDGVAYERSSGYRPYSITAGGKTYILMPVHGGACQTSDGVTGAGSDECVLVAVWDPEAQTFRSKDAEITLSPFNP